MRVAFKRKMCNIYKILVGIFYFLFNSCNNLFCSPDNQYMFLLNLDQNKLKKQLEVQERFFWDKISKLL